RINMLLVGGTPTSPGELKALVERRAELADLGVRVRPLRDSSFVIESDAGFLSDALAKGTTDAAHEIGVDPVPVLTYLATSIKANGRETPYSLVSALPQRTIEEAGKAGGAGGSAPIWLSRWTADDLGAHVGDAVTLDYYLWSDADGLTTSSSSF